MLEASIKLRCDSIGVSMTISIRPAHARSIPVTATGAQSRGSCRQPRRTSHGASL